MNDGRNRRQAAQDALKRLNCGTPPVQQGRPETPAVQAQGKLEAPAIAKSGTADPLADPLAKPAQDVNPLEGMGDGELLARSVAVCAGKNATSLDDLLMDPESASLVKEVVRRSMRGKFVAELAKAQAPPQPATPVVGVGSDDIAHDATQYAPRGDATEELSHLEPLPEGTGHAAPGFHEQIAAVNADIDNRGPVPLATDSHEAVAPPVAAPPVVLPPLTFRPEPAKEPGLLKRFFSSHTLWGGAILAMISGALYLVDGFQELARAAGYLMQNHPDASSFIKKVWEGAFNLPPLDTAKGMIYALWGAFGVSAVAAGISRLVGANKIADDYAGVPYATFNEARSYSIEQTSMLFQVPGGTTDGALRERMIKDAKLFESLDILRQNEKVFVQCMKTARMPRKLLAAFDKALAEVEATTVKMRLLSYTDAGIAQRQDQLQALFDKDQLLRRKLKETFAPGIYKGSYANPAKKENLISAMGGDDLHKGEKTFRELEGHYSELMNKES